SRSSVVLAPLPPAARHVASQSIVATQAVLARGLAQGAPPAQVAQVRAGAFDAFLDASHVTTAISLGVILLAAAVVGFLLPVIRPPQAGDVVGGPAVTPAPVDVTDAPLTDGAAGEPVEPVDVAGEPKT